MGAGESGDESVGVRVGDGVGVSTGVGAGREVTVMSTLPTLLVGSGSDWSAVRPLVVLMMVAPPVSLFTVTVMVKLALSPAPRVPTIHMPVDGS